MNSHISATKSLKLCIAHRLMYHDGKCKNLHGHNYKVTAEFVAQDFDSSTGMVLDFGIIKNVVFKRLDDQYDHTVFLYVNDPLIKILEPTGTPIVKMHSHPTAENMCYFFAVQINHMLLHMFNGKVYCPSVEVEETEGSVAKLFIDPSELLQEIKDVEQRAGIWKPAESEEQASAEEGNDQN